VHGYSWISITSLTRWTTWQLAWLLCSSLWCSLEWILWWWWITKCQFRCSL